MKHLIIDREDPRYLAILTHYGPSHQLSKLGEELHEASMAVMSHAVGSRFLEGLIQELADVYVISAQLVRYYGAEGYFEAVVNEKLERQIMRIAQEKSNG